ARSAVDPPCFQKEKVAARSLTSDRRHRRCCRARTPRSRRWLLAISLALGNRELKSCPQEIRIWEGPQPRPNRIVDDFVGRFPASPKRVVGGARAPARRRKELLAAGSWRVPRRSPGNGCTNAPIQTSAAQRRSPIVPEHSFHQAMAALLVSSPGRTRARRN